MRTRNLTLSAMLMLSTVAAPLHAGWPFSGSSRCSGCDRRQRAGYPDCVSEHAKPWPDRDYSGYYVGGGAAVRGRTPDFLHGQPRYCQEGTFGVDYTPWYSRVRLRWFHGTRYQDGQGQYDVDRKNNPFRISSRILVR